MIAHFLEVEDRLGYRINADGVLVNAPCCCYGDDHTGHPYCQEPTQALLAAERDGLITRQLNSGWHWIVWESHLTESSRSMMAKSAS